MVHMKQLFNLEGYSATILKNAIDDSGYGFIECRGRYLVIDMKNSLDPQMSDDLLRFSIELCKLTC